MDIDYKKLWPAAAATLSKSKNNIAIALIVTLICVVMDLSYTAFVNERYSFGLSGVLSKSTFLTFMILLISSYAGSAVLGLVVSIVLAFTAMQFGTFDFFGSYILPVHIALMVPEIKTVSTSFLENASDSLPSLAAGGALLLCAIFVLRLFWGERLRDRRAALILAILVGSDLMATYSYIAARRDKIGEFAFKNLYPGAEVLGAYNAYRSVRYLLAGTLPEKFFGEGLDFPALDEPQRVAQPDVNIVFILNESIRAENVSIFGYEQETMPRLAAMPGIYTDQIYAGGTMTRTAMAALLHRLQYPGMGEQFLSQSNCLFRLAQNNGFETTFIYAQSRAITNTLLPYMCPNYITNVLTQSDAAEDKQAYDESVPHLLERLDFTKPNFVVISPNGAHTPIAEKAPPDFKKFSNDYDNAILYSDHIAAEVIDYVRAHSSKPTYIFFTSDHGELLKGEDERRGHGWFKPRVVQVPFLYLPVNVPEPDPIRAEVAKVRSHFDLATVLVQVMGYDVTVNDDPNQEIYVNGSELSGLAGYMRLGFDNGALSEVKLIGSPEVVPSVEAMVIKR